MKLEGDHRVRIEVEVVHFFDGDERAVGITEGVLGGVAGGVAVARNLPGRVDGGSGAAVPA